MKEDQAVKLWEGSQSDLPNENVENPPLTKDSALAEEQHKLKGIFKAPFDSQNLFLERSSIHKAGVLSLRFLSFLNNMIAVLISPLLLLQVIKMRPLLLSITYNGIHAKKCEDEVYGAWDAWIEQQISSCPFNDALLKKYMYKFLKNFEQAPQVIKFLTRQIFFDWHGIAENLDCGIFLLYHCCMYEGQPFKAAGLAKGYGSSYLQSRNLCNFAAI